MESDVRFKLWIITYALLFITPADTVRWMGISHMPIDYTSNDYSQYIKDKPTFKEYGFNDRQFRSAQKNPGIISSVHMSSSTAKRICEATFNESRWNCSSLEKLPTLSPELRIGTREQAYVYALSSSLLAADVSKGCASGRIGSCSCSSKQRGATSRSATQGAFQWGGCSINVRYGIKFAEYFTDSPYRKFKKLINKGLPTDSSDRRTKEALMNIHNNKVGRAAVQNSLSLSCRCHGFSGSCEMKTCWKDLNEQRLISDLHKKYAVAQEFEPLAATPRSSEGSVEKRATTNDDKLIYYKMSSDYCSPDSNRGSLGTKGRKCGDESKNLCDWMCCGRGYRKIQYVRSARCNCQHIWCCYVKCDVCNLTITELVCN